MQILESKYITSSPAVDQCPPEKFPEFAFLGRSNVGKSSLINMLSNNSRLAKTSSTPGKTQLINHFEILSSIKKEKKKKWYLVDLPGYGFAKASQSSRRRWEQMIENYIRKRKSLANLFILVDSRHGPQKIDIEFIGQLGEWQIPFAIVFTKADKNKPNATQRNINAFMEELQKTWDQPPPFFSSSALTKEGREEILDYISDMIAEKN
jgi:GTP-binding protein